MKTRYSLIALAAFWGAPALFCGAPSVRLERDAPVTLRLKQALSSETARINDRVEFEVTEEVSVSGAIVIAKGSTAWGRVADAAPVGRLKRSGRLAVDIESVALADGRTVRLHASGAAHTGARKPHETKSDGPGALPPEPFGMFPYGKVIQIPAGKLVTVYTAAPVILGSIAQPHEVSARSAATESPAASASVLPALNAAPGSVVVDVRGPQPPAAASASVLSVVNAVPGSAVPADRSVLPPTGAAAVVLPAVGGAPGSAGAPDRVARPASPTREPVSVSRGESKKLLTILAVGAAAGLAGVLSAKGHGGTQTGAAAAGATPTTVGIGQISVGGPH